MQYIRRIAEVEAEIRFKDEELLELNERLNLMKDQKRQQQQEVSDKVNECKELYNRACQA
jgi:hypothetical protein